jgi:hypothetical protein
METNQLQGKLLAHYNFAAFVKPNQLKGGFSKINADRVNLPWDASGVHLLYPRGGRSGGPSY